MNDPNVSDTSPLDPTLDDTPYNDRVGATLIANTADDVDDDDSDEQ